jgi:hypothetical protein
MRATITMPLETLKAIIERAREYEFVDDDDELLDEDLEDEDEDDEIEDAPDDDTAPMSTAANDDDEALDNDDAEAGDDEEEFEDVLIGLTSDELAELLALAWVGDGDHAHWGEALDAAKALSPDDVVVQLAENPVLSDSIERGLEALGYEISDD